MSDFLKTIYPVEFSFVKSNDFLGKIEFDPLSITVNNNTDENRFRFTLCHEIGHLIMHSEILNDRIDAKEDNETTLSLNYYASEMSTRRLEIQANIFASYLLLPRKPLMEEVAKFFVKNDIRKGYIYLDNQMVNRVQVDSLLNTISERFKASKESVRIKLISLSILKDESNFSFRKHLKKLTK